MQITENVCPVCKSKRNEDNFSKISCDECHFEYAFIRYTAGKKSLQVLRDKIKLEKEKYKITRIEKYSVGNSFVLTGDTVAFISTGNNVLHIINGDGDHESTNNVAQYSANDRNRVILYCDGTIKVTGDNTYGQCNSNGLEKISFVRVAPNCVYTINENGYVKIIGKELSPNIREWKDIKFIACGSYHILGLTYDKTVKIAGDCIDDEIVKKVSNWKNVKSIATSTDCSLALFEDGTVSFAGRASDPRSHIEDWRNIVAINADSSYVIGITEDGGIKMAGDCKKYLDMGRSSAKTWSNIVAVTCSSSGIAGINDEGKLFVVGNFSGDFDSITKTWEENIERV